MSGKELVRRAVLFEGPKRVPKCLPEPWGTDFFGVGIGQDPVWKPRIETDRKREDEWGCIWEKLHGDKTMGQVTVHSLDDYAKLKNFRFPNYDLPERYQDIPVRLKENREEKFVLAGLPFSLVHRLTFVRGFEKAMTDPYTNPRELHQLLDSLADIAMQAVRRLAFLGVDGVFSCDDWGTEDRPFVSPSVFKEFFKGKYREVYHLAHELGMFTFLHSCGHITELMEDFIDAELDVIQMDQQENMGVENLARRFGGRICFWCPVDIQKTMVRGSLQDIRGYARKLIEQFGSYNGGFIAKWYSSPQAIGHSEERVRAMAEAFVEYGKYPLAGTAKS